MKKTAITFGDPNGISPEITIKALNFLDLPKNKVVLITNKNILDFYNEKYSLSLEKDYEIIEIPFKKEDIKPSKETEEAGEFSFKAIVKACVLAQNNEIDSIVTAPVSKNAMFMAGHNYSGQTEILEQYLAQNNQKAEMLFMCNNFSILLLTRHIALKEVPSLIKKEMIIDKVERLKLSLEKNFGKSDLKFAICALNPHAGENGLFGNEEEDEILPAVYYLRDNGINIEGPFPSDTLFMECIKKTSKYDCYIAMYHDQGLIPLKLFNRDNCVNTTIGLDILRTSPAHGVAFDIAGTNSANPESMIHAIQLAVKL